MAPRWERQWPGQNGAGPGCGWAGRTQPRSRTGHGGSGACCVGSNGPRIPDLISSRRHRPAWSLRTFQPSQGRRWRIPVPAPAARPAPRGTTAVPGTQTAVRQMDTSGLFQGPPGTRRRRRRRRNGWMLSQSSKTSESSSRAEKRMRPSSSCSCTACTLHVSLHSREGRTHWSRTAARQLWWRGLCTMTPALEPELETHLLRAALHEVFTLGMEKDTTQVQVDRAKSWIEEPAVILPQILANCLQWDVNERGQDMCLGFSPVLPRDPSSHPVAGVAPVSLSLTHGSPLLCRICIGSCQTSWTPCWGTCWQTPQIPTSSTTSWT
ncbi:uncharacterized protein LOC120389956 isoform X2 [Mauremys reevesii]|uniref:uncharacterized protein LOC120389956 isoform X1 n=1 Tax=Mauremys reevesii TaxID=260615 RepID=UPI00193EECB4|nr:uncharacterized protein LOC120389956 isoform X1 [Mauremys reevesii]XP_039368035.1 uncharacterized protein LOC120389956 isoform X1 [Mauremys reevesii]XP_039368036.1 uncharacterized protein LOC120389956 isoform X2 [Mauremys reevesii]